MYAMLSGAIAMGSTVIGLFFLRFWRDTRDRFFLYFALSFLIEGAHRVYSTLENAGSESSAHHYLIRLVAYLLILWAIWEKNWGSKGRQS
jgi:hypothetical protein